MNPISEKLINFRVYLDGTDLVGIADVQLPSLEPMKETVKGAGIAGEVESPVLGHYGSMKLSCNWRSVTKDVTKLAAPKAHNLDIRGAMQVYNSGTGTYSSVPVKLMVKAVPTKIDLGKFEMGATTDTSTEFEVSYMKLWIDGESKVEIDKYNYIAKFDGVDQLASVRRALGL